MHQVFMFWLTLLLAVRGIESLDFCFNASLEDTNQEFDLEFQSKDIKNYILLDNNVPAMSNMTLMFWINTLKAWKMAVLSYAVEESAFELRVFVAKDKIILVRIQSKLEFPVPPINDGYWHHVGITWSLGQYSIYLDGTLVYTGSGLGPGTPLRANGVFAIGQRLLSTSGNFHSGNSFSGKLSQVNMWDYDYISTSGVNMKLISQSCSNIEGNVINWSALQDLARGNVVKEQPRSCKPLRNNPEYDIIASSTEDIHIKPSENIPSLQAITITLWGKRLYGKNIKYSAETSLSFYIHEDVFKLEINAPGMLHFREAKVPTYQQDEYWHHIATTWSSETGDWKIYLDGLMVSIMYDVAFGITIPAGGHKLLLDEVSAHDSSLGRLNIWNYDINGEVLSLMAIKGPMFENGNVFAWYGVESKAKGNVTFQKTPSDLNNSYTTQEFDLKFPSKDIKNFILLDNSVPEPMSDMTLMFWVNTLKGGKMTVLSYAVHGSVGELRVFVERDKIMLEIHSLQAFFREFPVPPINDGYWHHVGITWFLGQYSIYLDGTLVYTGSDCGLSGTPLRANGVFAIGQNLLSNSENFHSGNSFSGKLSQVNMWDYEYISFAGVNMKLISQSCSNIVGNIINWSALQDLARGEVVKEQPRSCKPLRNNPEYDIIIASSTEDIHIKPSQNIPSLHAFTITLWGKRLYGKYIKFSAETSLLFSIDKDGFSLKIAYSEGGSELSADRKVSDPTYQQDEYWHHIATAWSSETGDWKIYLDGSLVHNMHSVVASGKTIPEGAQLLLGQAPGTSWVHDSSLSRLNIWDYEIDGHVLSLMANQGQGPLFENGNVFACGFSKKKFLGVKGKQDGKKVSSIPRPTMHRVFMFWLTLLLAVRGIESLDFCFNASLEGSRLNSTILKKVDVSSMMECVVSCVQEPCCRSINYRKRLPQDLASLCEMLHDVVYNTSAELEKNSSYDYIYFNAPRKEYNSSCDKDTTHEFDLEFPSKNKEIILLHNNVLTKISNMTLMFWINTSTADKMAVLSYAVEESDKELRVFVQGDKIMLVFQSKLEFPVPPLNDGYWHHVGITWSLGDYSIYLDGTLVYSGSGLGSGKPLRPNGVFAIGQKLLSTNGTFYSGNSFSGKLSQVNVWDYDYISTPGVNMTLISQNCSNPVGNVINWSALQDLASGKVVKEQPRSCKPLRN
ncbi:Hypothetical predicted protein, partial [Paramuricea clavata]